MSYTGPATLYQQHNDLSIQKLPKQYFSGRIRFRYAEIVNIKLTSFGHENKILLEIREDVEKLLGW